jgi:tetratricopeptide (TPR) repeat protein
MAFMTAVNAASRAREAAERGQFDEAIRCYLQAIQGAPGVQGDPGTLDGESLWGELGDVYLRAGEAANAIDALKKGALKKLPGQSQLALVSQPRLQLDPISLSRAAAEDELVARLLAGCVLGDTSRRAIAQKSP